MPGPQVSGPISTTASTDSFGTHDSLYGIGGLREVSDHTARNAIPDLRRRAGMLVFTANDNLYWRLIASPWTHTDSDWSLLIPDYQDFTFPTPQTQWVMNHSLGGQPDVSMRDGNDIITGEITYPSTSQVVVNFYNDGGMKGTARLKK